MSFVLTCCSTADLTNERLSELRVPYASFHYFLNNTPYNDDLGKTIPFDEFYRQMAEGAETRTSQVNISEYLELFTPILDRGEDILHICLSTGISGTYNSAISAARICNEKYPDRKIYIVDSLGASSGYGFLVEELAALRDEGKSLEFCRDWAMQNRLRVNHWFFSTDLSFYVKGGRISKTAGFFGSMLGICPLLNMDAEGRLIPRYKIRSKKKVIKEIVEKMVLYADNGLDYSGRCNISHSGCYEDARQVADLIEAQFPHLNGKVSIYYVGTTIGSHTGPGTVALFFFGRDRSLPLIGQPDKK